MPGGAGARNARAIVGHVIVAVELAMTINPNPGS